MPFRLELLWRLIAQGRVRSVFVVVSPPRLDLDLCILQRGEPALVQALLPEPTVETFYVCVLDRFSWSYEVQFHAVPVRPFIYRTGVNSVPLSVVITRGNPCSFASCSSTATTRFPVIEDPTSMAGLTRLK